jgi:hypothetical protein
VTEGLRNCAMKGLYRTLMLFDGGDAVVGNRKET